MQKLEPLVIPVEIASDFDAWEQKINQYGISHADSMQGECISVTRTSSWIPELPGCTSTARAAFLNVPNSQVAKGNRVGIAGPVLAALVFRAEGSPQRERNLLRVRQALDVWKLWLADVQTAFEYGRLAF